MGDFSRDTFTLTNVMHQLLTEEAVTDPRHYVGVRLQQGVPVLDSDWNELDDIRSLELRAVLRYFIGNGVPANDQGFQITSSGTNNNFAINRGVILVDGLLVINPAVVTYSTQPEVTDLPALTTPATGLDRNDVVYLDVWHSEIRANGSDKPDARLINPKIGVETAARIIRRWQVRVRENATNLSGLPVPPNHKYIPLALLQRLAGTGAIRDNMIIDRRKVGITLANNLKIPVHLQRGLEVLDAPRFVQMLRGLRTTLFARLKGDQLPYAPKSPVQKNESLILISLQQLMNQAHIGEAQTMGRNMDNEDALKHLDDLYAAQTAWTDLLLEIGNQGNAVKTFVDEYRKRLDGEPTTLIKGVKPALDRGDLLGAVIAQEVLNFWLAAPTDNLPEGEVTALYRSVIPFENLQAGSYTFTYEVTTNFTSPLAEEQFNVQITLPTGFGTATATPATFTVATPGDKRNVTITVNISGVVSSADLDVSVISARNATLRSSQPPITLTLGASPSVGTFFFYIGQRFNANGQLEIPVGHLTRSTGRNIPFRIKNESPSQNRRYQVTRKIAPNVPDKTGWAPLAETNLIPIIVSPGGEVDVADVRVDGPKPPAAAPSAGTTGIITATAVLTAIDGAPPPAPQTRVEIAVPFIVV